MQLVMGLIVGIGLAAACGFRVFVPLLGMNIAHQAGHLTLAPGFEWIGSMPALVAFATATILEIGAYYIPWLDNLVDSAATPAAIIAGTVVTASQLGEMSPFLKWALAIIAGGGICGVIQGGTVLTRAASTGTTGGLGNFLVASLELISSVLMTFLAIVLPVVGVIAMLIICGIMAWKIANRRPLQTSVTADPTSTAT